jgi:4-amino-4-deoxy-L-arabinose transferase-like glycosyltransferase
MRRPSTLLGAVLSEVDGRAALLLLLLFTAAVYFWRIGTAPIYLAPDEVIIANDAYAVAATGHTRSGIFLPLYFPAGVDSAWFMPVIYYAIALVLLVLPLAEWSIRTPTVLAAIASIALTYFVGIRLYRDRRAALVAAFVMACAPAFFILSRYALDYTLPVPFVLGWLLCLLIALDNRRSSWWFAAAGLCLGVGWYAYISSIVMMPVYFAMTFGVLAARRRGWRDAAAFTAGFVLPLTFFVAWLLQHPEAIAATARRYGFINSAASASAPALQSIDPVAMLRRFFNFFRADFLFRLGDTYLPFSTRTIGVFVGAAGVLMAVGLYSALVSMRSAVSCLVLAGFVVSPLAASVLQDEGAIRRAIGMVVFGALLAGYGAARLLKIERVHLFRPIAMAVCVVGLGAGISVLAWTGYMQGRISETATRVLVIAIGAAIAARLSSRVAHGMLIVAAVVAMVAWQFAGFQRTYHGEYQSRLAVWLNGNMRGALEQLIAESDRRPDAPVYFSTLRNGRGDWDVKNRYLPSYWRFYADKHDRSDLHDRAVFIAERDEVHSVPRGSLLLANIEDPHVNLYLRAVARHIIDIPEKNSAPYFTIYER